MFIANAWYWRDDSEPGFAMLPNLCNREREKQEIEEEEKEEDDEKE